MDASPIPSGHDVAPRRRRRSGVRRKKPDGRRWINRRARQLQSLYTATLRVNGRELSLDTVAEIARAAELGAIAEDMRQRLLRGQRVSPNHLVRCERLAAAAKRALLRSTPAKPPQPQVSSSLSDIIEGEA